MKSEQDLESRAIRWLIAIFAIYTAVAFGLGVLTGVVLV